jgi:undecaprenyl-diphosphatase
MNKKYLSISIVLLILSVCYTILVKNIDVAPIGPNGSEVGFSAINESVHNFIGVNMTWYNITKYLGVLPFLLIAYYGIQGVKQLISEKSLAKVDKKLIFLGVFYFVFVCVYVFFEKVIINYRPTIIDGELEASYPSSHTLLAICICGSSLLVSKYFIKNEKIRKILNVITIIIMLSIVIGRIISGVHWASDILGGIIISLFLLSTLKTAVSYVEK